MIEYTDEKFESLESEYNIASFQLETFGKEHLIFNITGLVLMLKLRLNIIYYTLK